jgi:hypothetical protein
LGRFRKILAESNIFLLDTMKELAVFFESGKYRKHKNILSCYRRLIKAKHQLYKGMIILLISELQKSLDEDKTRSILNFTKF